MASTHTISASEFKAKCLNILDQLTRHELDSVVITKRGQTVGVLLPPQPQPATTTELFGCMRGSVILPDDFDLTAPVLDEPLDAELGILHR